MHVHMHVHMHAHAGHCMHDHHPMHPTGQCHRSHALVALVHTRAHTTPLPAHPHITVIILVTDRGGETTLVENTELVVGDIYLLDTGDKVVADCIVFDSQGLVVDEASLTGESDPIKKIPEEDCWVRSGTQVRAACRGVGGPAWTLQLMSLHGRTP